MFPVSARESPPRAGNRDVNAACSPRDDAHTSELLLLSPRGPEQCAARCPGRSCGAAPECGLRSAASAELSPAAPGAALSCRGDTSQATNCHIEPSWTELSANNCPVHYMIHALRNIGSIHTKISTVHPFCKQIYLSLKFARQTRKYSAKTDVWVAGFKLV